MLQQVCLLAFEVVALLRRRDPGVDNNTARGSVVFLDDAFRADGGEIDEPLTAWRSDCCDDTVGLPSTQRGDGDPELVGCFGDLIVACL